MTVEFKTAETEIRRLLISTKRLVLVSLILQQYLDKRVWYPTHTYEIQLFCKLGNEYLNHPAEKVRHYGCYCGGSSADMKDYIKRDVKPMDDLDK